MCCLKSLEQIPLFIQTGINYSHKANEVYSAVHSYHEVRQVAVEKELMNVKTVFFKFMV